MAIVMDVLILLLEFVACDGGVVIALLVVIFVVRW
jgi:hypothetical protein